MADLFGILQCRDVTVFVENVPDDGNQLDRPLCVSLSRELAELVSRPCRQVEKFAGGKFVWGHLTEKRINHGIKREKRVK